MAEQRPESDYLAKRVHATEWAVVLMDWKNADAWVTVHLRGGVSLGPGKVTRLPGNATDSVVLHDPRPVETKWTFDLNDVMAITAEASR